MQEQKTDLNNQEPENLVDEKRFEADFNLIFGEQNAKQTSNSMESGKSG